MRIIFLLIGLFIASYSKAEQLNYSCWFDGLTNQLQNGVMNNSKVSFELDASHLSPGIHNIYVMVKDKDGIPTAITNRPFVKTLNAQNQEAYIYIDGEFFQTLQHTIETGKFESSLDLSNLETGLHTILTFIRSERGGLSPLKENLFWRVPSSEEIGSMRCVYVIDNTESQTYEGSISGDILLADIDASSLSDGLHSVSFMLINSIGQTTQFLSSYFLKMPIGGVNIKSYDYWINSKYEDRINVATENATNPYILTALIPLEKQDFRSSSYHFAMENGEPVIYTQNDFNLLLRDNRGFFTLHSFPYFEVSSRQNISKDMKEISFNRQEIEGIASNDIKWFKFNAQKGDSLSLRLTNHCAYEMYNPDGTLLFSNTPDKSNINKGKHTAQTGTHYLAIHEQLGEPYEFTAYLQRIDKFALLKTSPQRVIGGNIVIFDIEGNGFDSLKSVELINDKEDVIMNSEKFEIADWSFGKALFDFTESGIPNGEYKLLLTFADENGEETTQSKSVEFANGESEDLIVSVEPHNNSISEKREIEVTVSNPSEYAYWGIPFCIARTSTEPEMSFDFLLLSAEGNDYFTDPIVYDTDNLLGMGVRGRYLPLIIPYIGPKQKLVYKFSTPRVVNNDYELYAWCGEPWSLEEVRQNQETRSAFKTRSQASMDHNYQNLSNFQNIMNMGGHGSGAPSMGLSLGSLSISLGLSFAGIHQGLNGPRNELFNSDLRFQGVSEFMPQYNIPTAMTPAAILNGSGLLPLNVPDPNNPHNTLTNNCQQNAECGNPMPGNTPIRFPSSLDPNDLTGYISEAGTKFIGKSIDKIDYTIEFENDPKFATASALSAKIDSDLDIKLFELSSFTPKELKIGSKTYLFEESDLSHPFTIDLRPEINCIAEVKLDYDSKKGNMTLNITSLNPYTMDKSEDLSQGFLPVNIVGQGIGEFTYSIVLKNGLCHQTLIPNQASIVFDNNPPIKTPVWENMTDYISPESNIVSISPIDDNTLSFEIEGSDEGSGIWQYDLYTRYQDSEEWQLIKKGIIDSPYIYFSNSISSSQQFMTVAIDKAGNREENGVNHKYKGDLDRNGRVDVNDLVMLYSYYVGRPISIDRDVADMNNDGVIDSQDAVSIQKLYIGQTLIQNNAKCIIMK